MADRFLFKKIDNSQLIVFRIFFGLLLSLECYGAIFTGWVRRNLVEPEFTFNFIGFDWLQPLPGFGMYIYFFVMGTLGLLIAIGYRYRLSIIAFTVLWTGVYLMQKTAYNNHYYLLILISFLMCCFPANASVSFDARRNPAIRSESMHAYIRWIVILQLFIVYTYAAVAKLYADWLDMSFIRLLMQGKAHYAIVGELLQHPFIHYCILAGGIVFDLLIVPALLWKRSRPWAFAVAIFFHLFNSIVFQIGIFPYLSLAFTVFFFEPETIRRHFLRKKEPYEAGGVSAPPWRRAILMFWSIYFIIQLGLPLRHWFIKDDVLWTEEGHRMSWRMMLRSREGSIRFKIVDKDSGNASYVNVRDYVSRSQERKLAVYPDFIWQFAQRLKKLHAANGQDIAVYVESRLSLNGKPMRPFINPETDLAAEPWDHLRHHEWILPSPHSTTAD